MAPGNPDGAADHGNLPPIPLPAANGVPPSNGNAPVQPQTSPRYLQLPSPSHTVGTPPTFTPPNDQFIQDVRRPTVTTPSNEPVGLSFFGDTCYRNAAVIMLLSTRPLMSYIQNRLLPAVRAKKDDAKAQKRMVYLGEIGYQRSVPPDNYTNLLLTLNELFPIFWSGNSPTHVSALRGAMDSLVRYMQTVPMFTDLFPPNTQADAHELLNWCLMQAYGQISECSLFTQESAEFQGVYALGETTQLRCRSCTKEKQNRERHRKRQLETMNAWHLTLHVFDDNGQELDRQFFSLEELLSQWRKRPGESWYCDACDAKFRQKHQSSNRKEFEEALKDRQNGNDDWQWHWYVNLPEVVFISINRFKPLPEGKVLMRGQIPPKDERCVKVPEKIDLSEYLDHIVPDSHRRNMEYKLRGVILHAGGKDPADGKMKGHYINYLRAFDDQWWCMDGTDCQKMSFEDVNAPKRYLAPFRPGEKDTNFTPYVMCYERIVDVTNSTNPGASNSNVAASGQTQRPTTVQAPVPASGQLVAMRATQTEAAEPKEPEEPAALSRPITRTTPSPVALQGDQALLHIDLTLQDKPFHIEHAFQNFDLGLYDLIAASRKPGAAWKATIELPCSDTTQDAAKKGSKKSKSAATASKDGEDEPRKKFILLDSAISRTHFLPEDLNHQKYRSARLAAKQQQMIENERRGPPAKDASPPPATKRRCPSCPTHCLPALKKAKTTTRAPAPKASTSKAAPRSKKATTTKSGANKNKR